MHRILTIPPDPNFFPLAYSHFVVGIIIQIISVEVYIINSSFMKYLSEKGRVMFHQMLHLHFRQLVGDEFPFVSKIIDGFQV